MKVLTPFILLLAVMLFIVGITDAFTAKNGSVLIASSILIASVIISAKLEELKGKK
jgi:NADH:ubiquinone oxidoreductase subunit K